MAEPAETRVPEEPVAETPVAAEPDDPATRYCRACGDRVPLAADGLHCEQGHRLSPAHAKPKGLVRRLFGR